MPDLTVADWKMTVAQLRALKRTDAAITAERHLVRAALDAAAGDRKTAHWLTGLARRTFDRRLSELPAEDVPPRPKAGPSDGEIVAALHAAQGNRLAAARALGLHPRALQGWDAQTLSRKAGTKRLQRR